MKKRNTRIRCLHFEGFFVGNARETARRMLANKSVGSIALITAWNGSEAYRKTTKTIRKHHDPAQTATV